MTRTAWSNLLRESGGKWFLNIRPWWWAGPIWIGLSVIATEYQVGAPDTWILIVWMTLGVFSAVLFLFLMGTTVFRNRAVRPVPLWAMFVIGALAGAIKVLVFSAGMNWSSYYLPNNDILRFINVSLVGALIVPGIAVLYTFREQVVNIRSLLLRQNLRQFLLSPTAQEQVEHQELLNFVATARARVSEATNAQELAHEIDTIITTDLRPLTHNLWKSAESSLSNTQGRDVFLMVLKRHRFHLLPTLVLYLLSFSIVQLSAVGWLQGLGRLAVQSLIVVGCVWAANKVPQKSFVFGSGIFFGTNVLLASLITLVTNAIFGQLPYLPDAPAIAVLSAYFIGTSLIIGIVATTLDGHEQLVQQISDLESERLTQPGSQGPSGFQQRELAQHLHSKVQNQMLNSALRLSQFNTSNQETYRVEREVVSMILDDLTQYASITPESSMSGVVTSITRQWQGIVELTITKDLQTEPNPSLVRSIALVLNEAITNAVRHGKADSVDITLSTNPQTPHTIHIECVSNGMAPENPRAGLGFELFDALASQKWELTSGSHSRGSHLSILLTTN